MPIDLNELAVEVSRMEGGVENLSIAQIKEVMKCTFIALNKHADSDILEAIDRTADRYQ